MQIQHAAMHFSTQQAAFGKVGGAGAARREELQAAKAIQAGTCTRSIEASKQRRALPPPAPPPQLELCHHGVPLQQRQLNTLTRVGPSPTTTAATILIADSALMAINGGHVMWSHLAASADMWPLRPKLIGSYLKQQYLSTSPAVSLLLPESSCYCAVVASSSMSASLELSQQGCSKLSWTKGRKVGRCENSLRLELHAPFRPAKRCGALKSVHRFHERFQGRLSRS